MSTKKWLVSTLLVAGALALGLSAQEYGYRYSPEHRRPVTAAIEDLRSIESHESYNHKQQERYDHAILHLQQFAERLHEGGRFDKDKLDDAIGDIQHVLDQNRISESAREVLVRDITDLRMLRERYNDRSRYRY